MPFPSGGMASKQISKAYRIATGGGAIYASVHVRQYAIKCGFVLLRALM